MTELRLFYERRVYRGQLSKKLWELVPDDGFQVAVVMEPYPDDHRPWRGVDDRQLWTGYDEFNPTSDEARREVPALHAIADETWSVKRGSLLPDNVYFALWEQAAHGD